MVTMFAVEQLVRKMLGNAKAPVMALQDGTVMSDGHRSFNFQGAGVTVSDEPEARRTNVFIPGAPTSGSAFTLNSATGAGKLFHLGSAPSGWQNPGFVDTSWAAPIAQSSPTPHPAITSTAWVTYTTSTVATNDAFLLRHVFTLPAGTITSATVQFNLDDQPDSIYINGTAIPFTLSMTSTFLQTLVIPIGLLVPGGSNVLAFQVHNDNTIPAGYIAADYQVIVNMASAGVDSRYQLLSEKGAASGYAGLDSGALVPPGELGTGSPSSSTFLRGDQVWAAASTNAVVVQEVDGSPAVTATTIEFPNGTLTNPGGGGTARYTPAGTGVSLSPKRTMLSSSLSTTSTSLVAIDGTNMGFTQHSMTLAVGDIVEAFLQGEFNANSGSVTVFLDMEVDQPVSANVYSTTHANPAWRDTLDSTRHGRTAHFAFVCTEAGTHAFRPVWKVAAGQINSDATDTPLVFTVKNLGH